MNINSLATKSLLLVLCIKMENICWTPYRNENLTLYYAQNCLADFCGFCALSLWCCAVSSFSLFAITKFNFFMQREEFLSLMETKKRTRSETNCYQYWGRHCIRNDCKIVLWFQCCLFQNDKKNSYFQFKFHLRKSFQEFLKSQFFCCYS